MVIRQTSQRGERRRRALVDERRETAATGDEATADRGERANRSGRTYTDAAAREQQMPVCDLIPLRPWAMLIWLLSTLVVVAAHGAFEAAYQYGQRHHVNVDLSPLTLTTPRNFADFTVSLTLLLSAAYAALIVNFRRHKIDDYRGRYRLWYYVCGALVLMAFAVGGNVGRTVESVLAWVAAASGLPAQQGWLLGFTLLAFVASGVRLAIEIRASRGSVLALMAAAGTALYAIAVSAEWLQPRGAEYRHCVQSLAFLASAQFLLLSLVVYARFVLLDALGLIAKRERKTAPKKRQREQTKAANENRGANERATPSKSTEGRSPTKVAAPDQDPNPKDQRSSSAAVTAGQRTTTAAVDSEDSEDDDEPATVKLNRAERRRKRKEKRREPRAA